MLKKISIAFGLLVILLLVGTTFLKGDFTSLRSDSLSPIYPEPEANLCVYYIPSLGIYTDLTWNLTSDEPWYDVTSDGVMTDNYWLIPHCTLEVISLYGSIGENGFFVPYGMKNLNNSVPDTAPLAITSEDTSTKISSTLETLLNVWNNSKSTLVSLETELKTITDSQKILTDRKVVLEKKTGIESIAVVTARLAAIEKELTTLQRTLFKNTKLKSDEEYEPAKAQALIEFDAIVEEMRPLENQLTILTNTDLKKLTVELAILKSELSSLNKIKPQTAQIKTDIVNKKKEITYKNTEITNKNKEITAKKAEIAKMQTRKTAATNRFKTLQGYETKYIYPFRTKKVALNTEREQLTQKLVLLTAELEDINTKLWARLLALPALIENQKTIVAKAEKSYREYAATFFNGNNNNSSDDECNIATGENCDGDNNEDNSSGIWKSCCVWFYWSDETNNDFKPAMIAQCNSLVDKCDKHGIFPNPGGTSLQNDIVLDFCDGTAFSRFFGGGKYEKIETYYCGHSNDMSSDPTQTVCDPAAAVKEQIMTLASIGRPIPAHIEYFNTGCMTYNNLSAARAKAQDLYNFLQVQWYGWTVEISGYQNPSCSDNINVGGGVSYIVCSSWVIESFWPCPTAWSGCYVDPGNSSFQCDKDGETITMTCRKKDICVSDPDNSDCKPYDGVSQ